MKKLAFLLLLICMTFSAHSVVFASDSTYITLRDQNGNTISYHDAEDTPYSDYFSPDILAYTASVDYDVTDISINELIFSDDTYQSKKEYKLDIGVNILKYQPTNSNIIYTFTVTRDKNPAEKNDVTAIEVRNYYNSNTLEYELFDDGRDTYTVNVANNVSTILISIDTNSLSPLVLPETFSDGVDLHTGKNKFTITVISESGLKKNFTLIINREKSTVNYFDYFTIYNLNSKGKEVGSDNINYNPDSSYYRVDYSYDVSSIVIMFPATDIVYDNILFNDRSDFNFKLKVGANKIKITIVAENGNKKNYTLNVVRSKPSTKLSSLKINQYTCNIGLNTYNLNATYDISKVKINASAADKSAKVDGNGTYNLKYGANKFYITVTAANKTQKKYTININRTKEKKVKAIYYWVLME
jgi:hypothetical protein